MNETDRQQLQAAIRNLHASAEQAAREFPKIGAAGDALLGVFRVLRDARHR